MYIYIFVYVYVCTIYMCVYTWFKVGGGVDMNVHCWLPVPGILLPSQTITTRATNPGT